MQTIPVLEYEFEFPAMCPVCEHDVQIMASQEHIDEDWDYTCQNCGEDSPLSRYIAIGDVDNI